MKAAFHTLGCKTNHYETDAIAHRFEQAGFERVDFESTADVYIINTCTVTGEADRKSRQMLRRAKRLAPQAVVVAMGCHAQLSDASAYADIVIGTQGKARALELVQAFLDRQNTGTADDSTVRSSTTDTTDRPFEASHNSQTVHSAAVAQAALDDSYEELGIVDHQSECRAQIKIEDGCNAFCSYCAIPLARGRVRSRSEQTILDEGHALAAAGYREIVLTGIHVCSYGMDRGEASHAVMALAGRLAEIEGIDRIRLGSLEPLSITPDFIRLAAANPKLCPHFHLSLQSGSDPVLARMNRRYTTAQFREVARQLRQAIPAVSLTTDLIVGFPGETDAEFQQTLDFCAEIGFARLHIFRYSPRNGTVAATLPDPVPSTVSVARSQRLQDLADRLAADYHRQQLEIRQTVLVETIDESGVAHGYTAAYVPVRINPPHDFTVGQICSIWPSHADSQFLTADHAQAE